MSDQHPATGRSYCCQPSAADIATAADQPSQPSSRSKGGNSNDPALAAGVELTRGYSVIRLLDRSRNLEVYEVWSQERECRCVAKTVRRSRQHHRRLVARVLNEGRYLESFTHPHLVRAYETIELPTAILILEALPGQTLDHLIDTIRRPIPARSIGILGLHLCSAIQYLHRHNVLHLDLKPSNIICSQGLAKILDLSLAGPPRSVDPGCGTKGYLPPEHARGGMTTTAADVWGIGIVLYETATGQRPFAHEEPRHQHPQLTTRAPCVRTRRPRLPRCLSTIIDSCLEPDPPNRPTVAQVTSTLSEVVPNSIGPQRPAVV
ncbi:serine/threonine-protein kinase [Pseudonocardia lutea]|uniref:non-specific serine/threonine protein kinase n=1 Tax=Pseudonocardia lutea TaxID=2172015 RepID=A0ABW1IGZ3_9PSEU